MWGMSVPQGVAGISRTCLPKAIAECKRLWMTPRPQIDITAHCPCGRVTVQLHGPVHAMLLCSCEDCQQATGSGHSSVLLVSEANVVVEGTPKTFDRPANSGAVFTRYFCPDCGTPVSGRSSRAPHMVMLPAGLFGGATEGWFKPNQLIFSRSHRDWDTIADDLPQHQTYRGEW
jgi:hypothetical protein